MPSATPAPYQPERDPGYRLWNIIDEEIAQPIGPIHPKPRSSAVLAGWVCVGLGLLSAWLVPLGQLFFFIALVLAVVALATHQVKEGFVLLFCTLAGSAICVAVFFGLTMGTVNLAAKSAAAFQHQALVQPAMSPVPASAVPAAAAPAAPPRRTSWYVPPPSVPGVPRLPVGDLATMLRVGWSDEEIIAELSRKPLDGQFDEAHLRYLQTQGAGSKLVACLRAHPAYAEDERMRVSAGPISRPYSPPALPQEPVIQQSVAVGGVPGALSPVAALAQKDSRVAELKTRIDELDEKMMLVRSNPRQLLYWWRYYSTNGQYSGVDQMRLKAYLDQLDRERNELRREKWRLEGR